MWTDLSSDLSQSTRLTDRQTGRQTDEQTAFSSLDRVYIACSAVKTTLRLSDNVGYSKLERSFDHLHFLLTEKKR